MTKSTVADRPEELAASAEAHTPTTRVQKTPIVPVPPDAPAMQYRHPKYGRPSATWAYPDADGNLIGYFCRWDMSDSDGHPAKEYRPVCYCDLGDGRHDWQPTGFPEPRPLYGLPDIAKRPDATVIVTEGEKAGDAAAKIFPDSVSTTPPHGAKSPHRADWSPLNGRRVIIWPDNDEAGQDFANAAASLAIDAGAADVRIVEVPSDFPEKWDLADPVPDSWTTDDLRRLLDEAPVSPIVDVPTGDTAASDSSVQYPFRLTENAVEYHAERKEGREWEHVCSYLDVAALTRSATGEDWGRLVRVRDRDGGVHEWAMPMAMLAGSGEEYRRHLLNLGLEIAPGQKARHRLQEYISTCNPEARVQCVPRVGWHGQTFVLPDETIGETGGNPVLLQTEARLDHAFDRHGELAEWQDQVARYAVGNSRLVLSISSALAGPLLHLINAESGGFHLRGPSSIGKTTALAVAASVWGGGGVKGYIRQWRATDNGLEAVAQAHCDTLLCLDELSQIDGRAAGAAAYMLANGAGKARAGRGGEGRKPAEWRVFFLSTGEIGIADKVAEDGRGKRITAGQEVRVIDVPADAGAGLGLFETIHGFQGAEAFARHLQQAAREIYGSAARDFLRQIVGSIGDMSDAVRGFVGEFVEEHCPAGADGQVTRAAQRFALVAAAGELAIKIGVLPWPKGEAIHGVGVCFSAWLETRGGTEPAEVTTALSQVRRFIEQHGESRFRPWNADDNHRTINRAGFRRSTGDGEEYFVLPEVWKSEVCAGLDPRVVATALMDRGLLIPDSDGKPQSRHRLPGSERTIRFYRLAPAILGGAENA